MRISTKVDYALRAMAEIAAADAEIPVKAEIVSKRQRIPLKFLLAILNQLTRGRLIRSVRGPQGGYALSRPAAEITLADVMRCIEGPLANVHDDSLRQLKYSGSAVGLKTVWKALRASLRSVLEETTIAQLAADRLPRSVKMLAARYDRAERGRR